LRIVPSDPDFPVGVLDPKTSAFFAERCYLEQATLSRLLELYQQKSNDEADSALTRFVKELLRLDEVDALIDGLHIAGHVTRVRNSSPAFARATEEVEEYKARAAQLEEQRLELKRAIERLRDELSPGLLELDVQEMPADVRPSDGDSIQQRLDDDLERVTIDRAIALNRRVGDLERRATELDQVARTRTSADAEAAEATARQHHDRWRAAHGNALDGVLTELRKDFPHLPSVDSTLPSEAYDAAVESVDAEIARLDALTAAEAEAASRLADAESEVSRARQRLGALDRELPGAAAVSELGSIAAALADLAPHITDDQCPVCGRDFSEVSGRPLTAHLTEEISRLGAQANRLQAVAKARLETTTDLQRSEATVALLSSRRLSAERLNSEIARRDGFVRLRDVLLPHATGAATGGAIMRRLVEAQSALARAHSLDRASVDLRAEIDRVAAEVPGTDDVADEAPAEVLARIRRSLSTMEEAARERRALRWHSAELRRQLVRSVRELDVVDADLARVAKDLKLRRGALAEATRRMMRARALLRDVKSVRKSIVNGVFNSALNDVWADLFVRLAPDEPYVPTFCEPGDAGPVTARLETRRSDGSRGGSPRDMLSAGNLNTAALTLFLALHLSVTPRVPWLLLDDPVQSMDEIHVSQFAALLRMLTQQHQRRLVIAVHERALFEYLALELSPATSDASLVTIELRRERNDQSSVDVDWREFTPDSALDVA